VVCKSIPTASTSLFVDGLHTWVVIIGRSGQGKIFAFVAAKQRSNLPLQFLSHFSINIDVLNGKADD